MVAALLDSHPSIGYTAHSLAQWFAESNLAMTQRTEDSEETRQAMHNNQEPLSELAQQLTLCPTTLMKK